MQKILPDLRFKDANSKERPMGERYSMIEQRPRFVEQEPQIAAFGNIGSPALVVAGVTSMRRQQHYR
jgi:hypothetical protein